MFAICGALAILLGALTMLLAAVLVRHPSVPQLWKGECVDTTSAIIVTSAFGMGVTFIGMEVEQAAVWQWGVAAAIIVVCALALPIFVFRKLAHHWLDLPPKAPVVMLPKRKRPPTRMAANQRGRGRRAA